MAHTAIATDAPSVPQDEGEDLDLLVAAVRSATGLPHARPRAGQQALYLDAISALEHDRDVIALAPTGSGKSFITLSIAFRAAVRSGHRTLLSTHSLSLMGQMEDKDVPTMHVALAETHPEATVRVAFLRGANNYADPAKAIATAQVLLATDDHDLVRLASGLDTLIPNRADLVELGDVGDPGEFAQLVRWALRVHLTDREPGDRHTCPMPHTEDGWRGVSASSSEADDGSRFGVTSRLELAKDRASRADIVITNHSMLAVQAAKRLRIVTGGKRLGTFDLVIVDEAHELPAAVRSQGEAKLSGGILLTAAARAYRAAGSPSTLRSWMDEAEVIAGEIDDQLRPFAPHRHQPDETRRLRPDDAPLADQDIRVKVWAERGMAALESMTHSRDVTKQIRAASASDRLAQMPALVKEIGRHRSGWARWVEHSEPNENRRAWLVGCVKPVSVGWLLQDNLWTVLEEDGESRRLPVFALSATIPAGFAQQAGLNAQATAYPTPFALAYERSALFIPHLTGQDLSQVTREGRYGKPQFDVGRHAEWCTDQIVDLVRGNAGRALVLSATSASGRRYADALRARLPRGIRVHTQWDAKTTGAVTAEWRADVGSVLVGTKSLMTGVDAPGETCSLVIIDRVPRSPKNPSDEARVDDLVERLQLDRFSSSHLIYAADAALLLAQAAGRLIRSESDTGMVACLDLRLLKTQLAYPEITRSLYMGAFSALGNRFTSTDSAVGWLVSRGV